MPSRSAWYSGKERAEIANQSLTNPKPFAMLIHKHLHITLLLGKPQTTTIRRMNLTRDKTTLPSPRSPKRRKSPFGTRNTDQQKTTGKEEEDTRAHTPTISPGTPTKVTSEDPKTPLNFEVPGARLSKFTHQWEGAPPSTLNIVKRGFHWKWVSSPPPLAHQTRGNSASPELRAEVGELARKGAIYKVPWQPAFISPIFLVPKSSGGFRLILDLSLLNLYIQTPQFRMTNHSELANRLTPPAWMVSLDLQDAYLHIPIRKSLHRYLAFTLDNELWFFRALPFGLSPAPYLFTRILRWPLSILRSQGVQVLAYLDDWILWAKSAELLQVHVSMACDLLTKLGWLINLEKSHLTPCTDLTWLGVRWLPQQARWGLLREKVLAISQAAQVMISKKQSSLRGWEQLVGKCVFAAQILRSLQPALQPLFAPACFNKTVDRDKKIHLPLVLLAHLQPWTSQENLSATPHFHIAGPALEMWTDASISGWGGHTHTLETSGEWSPTEKSLHINILELRAVCLTIQNLNLKQATIHLFIDNQAAMFAINKMRCKSPSLMTELSSLLEILQTRTLAVKAFRITSKFNTKADALSRQQLALTEISLPRQLFRALCNWGGGGGKYQIDVMASRENAQLPLFYSRLKDNLALGHKFTTH